jgi:hypothetical protein
VADQQTNQLPFSSPIDLQSLIYVQRSIGNGNFADEKITPQMIINAVPPSSGSSAGIDLGNFRANHVCRVGGTTQSTAQILFEIFGDNTNYKLYVNGFYLTGLAQDLENPLYPSIEYLLNFDFTTENSMTFCVIEAGSGLQTRVLTVNKEVCP